MASIRVCYQWRVKTSIKKLRKKNDKVYTQYFDVIGADLTCLKISLEKQCKKKSFKVVQILTYQAVGISFAFHHSEPECPYLSPDEIRSLPLPENGKEIPYPNPDTAKVSSS